MGWFNANVTQDPAAVIKPSGLLIDQRGVAPGVAESSQQHASGPQHGHATRATLYVPGSQAPKSRVNITFADQTEQDDA